MAGMDSDGLMRRAQEKAEECGIEFNPLWTGKPIYMDPDSEFVREALELAGTQRPRTVAFGTDGAMLTELERLVVMGPGDIAQAHTHDEWILLDQIEKGTDLFTQMIRRWCGAPN
jgi:acetylornithine deacetylase